MIAQRPAEPRDSARLLVLSRATGAIAHRVFRDVVEYLRPGDCLVVNDTQVIPARFYCRRATGGRIEGLFLRVDGDAWRVLLKRADRLRPGERLACERGELDLIVEQRHERGEWSLRPVARGGDASPVADAPPEEAQRRVSLVMTQLIGVAIARHLIGLGPIAEWDLDELAVALAPTVARYLRGDLSEPVDPAALRMPPKSPWKEAR